MKTTPEYWAVLAQVMPLIALTVILEARSMIGSWDLQTPKRLRYGLSLVWALILIVLGIAESRALIALRGGPVDERWATFAETAITWGLGVVVLAPAFEFLVRGYAEVVARVLTWRPLLRFRYWRLDRQALRWIRKTFKSHERRWTTQRHLSEGIEELAGHVANAEWAIRAMNQLGDRAPEEAVVNRSEVEEFLRKARPHLEEMRRVHAEATALLTETGQDLEGKRGEFLRKREERAKSWGALALREREELARFLLERPVFPERHRQSSDRGPEDGSPTGGSSLT